MLLKRTPAAAGLVMSLALLCCFLSVGCAVPRPTLNPEQLAQVKARYLEAARTDTRTANEKMLRRMYAEQSAHLLALDAHAPPTEALPEAPHPHSTLPPTYDILILSGGGDYGAFGAGFLKAWGQITDPAFARPEFDMVTGVSTGALIAPFAFIGDDPSYTQLIDLYSTPKADWFSSRGPFFFLPGNESFMDNRGLRRDLEAAVNESVVAHIARESRNDRVLAINTTNLDVGAMHPFELSAEAERAEATGDRKRLHDILLASAAIPAVFPPVIIDGALYVDGGTTSNILYGANWLSPRAPLAVWRERHPHLPRPRIRFWVIINNQLESTAHVVQPTWISITRSSVATTIRSGTAIALRHLYSQVSTMRAEGWDADFRYVSIPESWFPPNDRPFDKDVMQSLVNLGLQMGADPTSWRSDFAR